MNTKEQKTTIDLKALNNWLRKINPYHPNLKQKQPAFGKINPLSDEGSCGKNKNCI